MFPPADVYHWSKTSKSRTHLIGNVNESWLQRCNLICCVNKCITRRSHSHSFIHPAKPNPSLWSVGVTTYGDERRQKSRCRHWVTDILHTPFPVWFLCNDPGASGQPSAQLGRSVGGPSCAIGGGQRTRQEETASFLFSFFFLHPSCAEMWEINKREPPAETGKKGKLLINDGGSLNSLGKTCKTRHHKGSYVC